MAERVLEPELTVAVCTRNRAALLAGLLRSLSDQSGTTLAYEVLVVDNGSEDDTVKVAYAARDAGLPLRYEREPVVGLSHARNCAWQVARGQYIAYTDDDCLVPPHWVATATKIIRELAPAAFGGPFRPFYAGAKPRWYRDEYGSSGGSDEPHHLLPNESIAGGNLFFRRCLVRELGGFSPDLGMRGAAIGYGEETALLIEMRQRFPDQVYYYDPSLCVKHLVRPEKLSLTWRARQLFSGAPSKYRALHGARPPTGRRQLALDLAKCVGRLARDVVWGSIRSDRSRFPFIHNYLYEIGLCELETLGLLVDDFRGLTGRSREAH